MINRIFVSTSDTSLIRSAQTVAIAQLGFRWIMGPVNLIKTVQLVPASKWAYMVLDGNSGAIYTTNSGPPAGSKTSVVATSLSTITANFAPTPIQVSPPPFVRTFEALINGFTQSLAGGAAPLTAAFTTTQNYNGAGTVTGFFDYGDGTAQVSYTSGVTLNHTYATGSWTASLSITESLYNTTSSAFVYVSASVPTLIPLFYATPASNVAPFTASFTNSSSVSVGSGVSYSYRWVFGDGTTSTSYQPTHVYQTGSFPVRLEITESGYGITAAYVLAGGITGAVPTLTVSFTTQSIGFGGVPESYMEPVTMSFTASAVTYIGSGSLTYNWNFGNGAESRSNAGPIGDVMYALGGYTASLSVTESSYNITAISSQRFVVSS